MPVSNKILLAIITRRERLGLGDHLAVMGAMLRKIATNLKAFGGAEVVVEQTLTLFQARSEWVLWGQRGARGGHQRQRCRGNMPRQTTQAHTPSGRTWPRAT